MSSNSFVLYTIGYERSKIEDFVTTIQAAGIDTVIDVRQLASSRVKGFSKNALRDCLIENGVEYHHLKGLGDPKEGRVAAREGRFEDFTRIFYSHMETDIAQAHLSEAIEVINENTTCLMCYERDPSICHRSIVAELISSETDISVTHLGVREGIAYDSSSSRRARSSFSEGVAAAE